MTIVRKFTNQKGKKVVIRYPRWTDLDELLAFANKLSRENTYVMLSGEVISRKQEEKYLREIIEAIAKKERIHLVATVDGKLAANSGITIFKRRKSHVGELNISVTRAYRGEGLGAALLKSLLDEAARHGLRLVVLTTMENNRRAIHIYEKAGFRQAGIIPGVYSYHRKFIGEILMYCPLVSVYG